VDELDEPLWLPMSGHGPWVEPDGGTAPDGGVAAAAEPVLEEPVLEEPVLEEPVFEELFVPVEPVPVEADVDVLAGVVVVVAALEAMVPIPSPRPAVPAMTPSATTAFLNRECMSHLPCRVGKFPVRSMTTPRVVSRLSGRWEGSKRSVNVHSHAVIALRL